MHICVFFFLCVCMNVNFYFTGVNTQQCNCWAIWRLCGYMGLFLSPQLFSPDLFFFFMSIPHCLQWCCFVLSFENRNTNPVLVFKNNLFHFYLFFCVCICAWCAEVRGQLLGVGIKLRSSDLSGSTFTSHAIWPAYFILH